MKNSILFVLTSCIFLFVIESGFSQTYLHDNTAVSTCAGTYYDAGGINGNYSNQNGQTVFKTFTSSNGNRLKFNFVQFVTEGNGLDFLTVYDGPDNTYPPIGVYQGSLSPFAVEGSGTSLTFGFTSSFQNTFAGWTANISCTTSPLPVFNMSTGVITGCSGMFYDAGGANGNYPNFENRTQTFCSGNGQRIVASFNPLETELSFGDTLWAYDGTSISAPLLGIFVANSNIETLTSSGTCLTFRFKSDGSNGGGGWAAQLSCTTAAPNPLVYSISPGVRNTCDGIFTDDGGESGNYANLSNGTRVQTFSSYNGNRLKINFQQFITETGLDILSVHDGPSTAFPVIGQYSGSLSPFSVEGSGSSLTFSWVSSFQNTFAGWRGTFECTTPVLPVYNMNTGVINSCSGMFYDAGGASGNYPNFENRIQTFCSGNGQRLVATFNPLETELSSGDTLWAYDGTSVSAPLLGVFISNSIIETLTSSGTCLTFRFKSDGSNGGGGWAAQLSCTNTAPAPTVYVNSSGTRYTCDGIFTDDGGENGNYTNLSNGTRVQTFSSYNGNRLKINFQQFSTELNLDILTIHDGPTTSHPVIGRYSGTLNPFSVEGTGSSLTFSWVSSFQTTFAGWRGTFECTSPVLSVYNMSSGTINTCGGMFYDAGGASGNYPALENRTQTFCSGNGQKIVATFNPLETGFDLGDTLWAYDGISISSPLLGVFIVGSTIETLTSSGTCLTFRFKSDFGNNAKGWAAQLSCTNSAPATTVYVNSTGIRFTCDGIFADDGGENGNYTNLSNGTRVQTFSSYNGNRLKINFQQFSTESNLDILTIHDGPTTSHPVIGRYSGTLNPFSVEGTGSSLTFSWVSSFQTTFSGWRGTFECTAPVLFVYNMSSGTINTCSGMFYDAGGASGNYPNFENRTQTFCSNNGQNLQFAFNPLAFNLSGSDTLWAFDGNSTQSNPLGIFVAGSTIENLISSGTCLTFRFKSINSPSSGWAAAISCVSGPPAQVYYPINPGVRYVCSGIFTDDGGPNSNYSNLFNGNISETFGSYNGNRLKVNFQQFSTEGNNLDYLQIFDGPNVNSPLIGTFQGSLSPFSIESSGRFLTFRWFSSSQTTFSGWQGFFECTTPVLPVYNMSSGTVSSCSGVFYDAGGATSNYANFENRTQTFCSSNGQKVQFRFNPLAFSLPGDSLWVYDGNSAQSPLKGIYISNSDVETLTSSGTCLTFRFKSDGSVNGQGWQAILSCVTESSLSVYPLSTGVRVVCNGIFTDDGGLNGNYSNNLFREQTFQSAGNERLSFVFNGFSMDNSDILEAFDGPNTNFPRIALLQGSIANGTTITSTGTSITFRFSSNSSSNSAGWVANIACSGPALPTFNMASGTVNTCSGVFYDSNGGGVAYSNNENRIQTFCSDNGQRIVFDFTNFELEGNDSLWAYDGNSISAPFIGLYLNSFLPEKITSSGTCITFRFKSNAASALNGWKALISCSNEAPAQVVYPMNTGIRTACSGIFTDDGGLSFNYSNNQNRVFTLQGYNNQRIRLNFQQFQTENNLDRLLIFDGPNISSPTLGNFTGTTGPGIITSTGNSLTFWFISDGSTTGNWAATIECAGAPLTPYNMSSGTVNTCSGAFYDAGGVGGRYPANENRIQTFCSDNGQKIRFDFNNKAFDLFTDSLFVYDGNNISSPLVGIYVSSSVVEPLVSSGTCLTFRFKSDNTNSEGTGWGAIISCTSLNPGPLTYAMSSGLRVVCEGTFTDDGGVNGNYGNSVTRVQTFQSPNNNRLRFDFTQFSTELSLDYMDVFDGPTTNHPYLGRFSGTSGPGVILSSGNSLTFLFRADNSSTFSGWSADISCAGPALTAYNLSNIPVNACEGIWYDNNGPARNYTAGQNVSQTFCSPTGQRMVFNFNSNEFNLAFNDTLFAYDGNSTASQLIGTYVGGKIEPVVSSGSCITFRFKGINSASFSGWSAIFSCTDNPPQPEFIAMRKGKRAVCSGIFTDDGGISRDYQSSVDNIMTFESSTPGAKLQFNFSEFNTESCCDKLSIYDGQNLNAPLIGTYSGSNIPPGIVTSSGSSLTFRWIADNSAVATGWRASISCVSTVPLVGTLTGAPFCAGSAIQIPFTSPNQVDGNVFTAQLSDANGTFSNPTLIGSISGTSSGTISGNLPNNLTQSGKYRIRIVASSPANSGLPSQPFTILQTPAQPASISGLSTVCAGSQNISYSIAAVSGASGYIWVVPSGASIISGQGTTSVLVNFGTGSGSISVTPSNSCGNGTARTLSVSVNSATSPTASISSNATNGQVCQGSSVTFSSTVSSGTNPQYQWIVNGNDVPGATGSQLSLGNLQNNANVALRVSSTSGCFNPVSVTSSNLAISVIPSVAPLVTISSSAINNTLCSGQAVTFSSSVANGGTAPVLQWRVNGQNVAGANGATFSPSNLQNGDQVGLLLSSNAACASPAVVLSAPLTLIVIQTVVPSVSIVSNTGGNQVCGGNQLILSANISNGGNNPAFQWFRNGSPISGETGSSYITPSDLSGSVNFSVRLSSNAVCASPALLNSPDFLVNAVSSVLPSVSVSSDIPPGPVCLGTSITFTANPANGGLSPAYQWRINGNPVSGQTGPVFTSSTLANNDQISVLLSSSDPCASPQTALSPPVTLNLASVLSASVTAVSSAAGNAICQGESITFTANPVNGGGNPQYQWSVNGSDVPGQTAASFSSSNLVNNDQVRVRMNSSFSCASPQTSVSAPVSVLVNPAVQPSVSISGSLGTSFCQGLTSVLTAGTSNGGANPAFQWFLNGSPLAGQTGSTLSTPTNLSGSAAYTVQLTSNANCASPAQVVSLAFNISIIPTIAPAVAMSSSVPGNTICSGQNITFTAVPENGGSNPQYQWLLNGNDIPGQTASAFSSSSLSGSDQISVRMTSNALCAQPSTVTSASQTVTVTPNSPASVSVVSNVPGNALCSGQLVTFTANPVNGGTNPTYQWILNGINLSGQTGATFQTSTLANNDQVSVRINSNSACANPATAISTPLTMNILPPLLPSVSLSNQPAGTSFCAGTPVLFTASPVNGGPAPVYSWTVNGNAVPNVSGSTFSLVLNSAAAVGVSLVSNAPCANPNPVLSTPVQLAIIPAPVVTAQNDTAICEATGAFSLQASPAGGAWSGTGVSSAGIFTPQATGIFKVYYSYTDPQSNCSGLDSVLVTVRARPSIFFPAQQPICATAPARQLNATPSGGTWSGTGVTAGGLFNPALTGPGLQAVVYTATQNGCSAGKVLTISVTAPPVVDAGGTETVCFSTNEVQLTGLPAGGIWSGSGVNSSGLFTPGFVTPGTTVTLTYSVNADGCTASKTKQITVSFDPVSVNAGPDQTVCISDPPFVLSGFTGSGGSWTGTGVNAAGVFNPAVAGVGTFTLTYSVSFIQSPLCTGSDSKTITVISAPQAPAGQGDTICRQGSATLAVSGGSGPYRWYNTPTGGTALPGQTNAVFTTPVLSSSATYYVSRVAGTCESPRTALLAFVIDFNNTSFSVSGLPPLLTAAPAGAQSYQWLLGGNAISGATQGTFQPVQSGDYSVIVQFNGCADTSSQQFVLVTQTAGRAGEPNRRIYPNPVSRELNITGEGLQEIRLRDAMGKTLLIQKGKDQDSQKLDVSELPNGLYHLELQFRDGIRKQKVMKQ